MDEPSPDLTFGIPSRSRVLSSSVEPLVASQAGELLPYRRWAALIALLLGEIIALTVSFDRASIARGAGWWSSLLVRSSQLLQVAVATVVAALLFGGSRLRAELLRHLDQEVRSHRLWLPLLTHLAAFGLFAWITTFVFGGRLLHSAHPGGWAVAWFGTGLVALAWWAAAAIPPNLWWPLARSGGGAIALGVVVVVVALGLDRLVDRLWEPLARSTFLPVEALLRLASSDIVCRPEDMIVGTAAFQVSIAPQCSGYEGIGLVWAFLAAYLWLSRANLRFPQAWLLIPLGTAFIWLANAARIVALVAVGTWVSADIAAGGFHSQAGWLAFNAIALGLVVASRRSPFFAKTHSADDRGAWENPAAAYLVPVLSIVAVTLIAGAFTVGFDVYYPLRVLAAAAAIYYFRASYKELLKVPSGQAIALGAATFAVWMALEPYPSHDRAPAALASFTEPWRTIWLWFRVAGSVITVPIAEELAFRGYLIGRLVAADFTTVRPGRFTWLSFLISSTLFGALHGRWLAGTLAGMAYALALYRRGAIVDAIAAHATTNALIACVVLAIGRWSLWS